MSTIGEMKLEPVFHRIKVNLYPSYFSNVEGAYIAKTDNEKTLDIEDICAIMKTRGKFGGDYETLVSNIREYIDEVAYQLCDGYAVSNGYYSISPNIGGSFNSANEAHDPKKHRVGFRLITRKNLRELAKRVVIEVKGVMDKSAYIDQFMDKEEESLNHSFVPGNMFAIHGHKIKVAGNEDDNAGVFLVPVDNPSAAVKVTRIADNTPSLITGIIPETEFALNKIEIRTRFSGANDKPLKTMRTITSSFTLEKG